MEEVVNVLTDYLNVGTCLRLSYTSKKLQDILVNDDSVWASFRISSKSGINYDKVHKTLRQKGVRCRECGIKRPPTHCRVRRVCVSCAEEDGFSEMVDRKYISAIYSMREWKFKKRLLLQFFNSRVVRKSVPGLRYMYWKKDVIDFFNNQKGFVI